MLLRAQRVTGSIAPRAALECSWPVRATAARIPATAASVPDRPRARRRADRASELADATEAAKPIAIPAAISSAASFRSRRCTADGCAPSAMRTSISRVRRLTEYAITPYRPAAPAAAPAMRTRPPAMPRSGAKWLPACYRCVPSWSANRMWQCPDRGDESRRTAPAATPARSSACERPM